MVPKSLARLSFLSLLSFIMLGLFAGCGSLSAGRAPDKTSAWLNSGALSFGGPVPQVSAAIQIPATNADNFAYGFAPTQPAARSLVLDISHKTARLVQGGKELAAAQLLDTSGLELGSYKVAHKQRNPLWYAPEDYFNTRGLSVPAEGDKQRYLRGAFGDFALFVSPTEAIHSGPFALSELTGARIDEQDFAKIFYLVEVGDTIRVE